MIGFYVLGIAVGVLSDFAANEKRVAIVPEGVKALHASGLEVLVESGAGRGAYFQDQEYGKAGATIIPGRKELLTRANIVLSVQRPTIDDTVSMKPGTIVIGLILPDRYPEVSNALLEQKITAFSLERIPRISRAQAMDVLTSQSSCAGYSAALAAACETPRFMPMLSTAAGTVRPSKVLVIGAGVAGLMAIATARRLGASVTGYDVRKTAGEDVKSLGARFLDLSIEASTSGGYARELTQEEKRIQSDALEKEICSSDVVITTASVPGKKAPMIIGRHTIVKMRRGSVIVDLAADSGGNCELTKPGFSTIVEGVKILGFVDFPSRVPVNSSEMFSRNAIEFLKLLVRDGKLVSSYGDEILKATMLTQAKEAVEGGAK